MNSLPTIGETTILGLSTLQFGLSCSLGASAGSSSRACSSFGPAVKQRLGLGFYLKGAREYTRETQREMAIDEGRLDRV